MYEDWHLERLKVRPGVTGLWQVSGRSDLSFDEYVRLDLSYIKNWSLKVDLYILVKTVWLTMVDLFYILVRTVGALLRRR